MIRLLVEDQGGGGSLVCDQVWCEGWWRRTCMLRSLLWPWDAAACTASHTRGEESSVEAHRPHDSRSSSTACCCDEEHGPVGRRPASSLAAALADSITCVWRRAGAREHHMHQAGAQVAQLP